MATVAISLGFPLGFLVQNFINETLVTHYKIDWHIVQFMYSLIACACALLAFFFFSEKYAEYDEQENESTQDVIYKDDEIPPSLTKEKLEYLIRILWFAGLILNSCANNSIMIHLVN